MALLVSSVFGVTGCGSDDGEAPVESRIKNYSNENYFIHPLCERSLYSESLFCARGSNGAGEGAEFEELEELEDFMKFDDMDDESSIKCSHSTARISPNDSYKSPSKSFCETPLEESYDDDLDDGG
jgi:hypothetical protein